VKRRTCVGSSCARFPLLLLLCSSKPDQTSTKARPDQHQCQEQSKEAAEERGGSEAGLGLRKSLGVWY